MLLAASTILLSSAFAAGRAVPQGAEVDVVPTRAGAAQAEDAELRARRDPADDVWRVEHVERSVNEVLVEWARALTGREEQRESFRAQTPPGAVVVRGRFELEPFDTDAVRLEVRHGALGADRTLDLLDALDCALGAPDGAAWLRVKFKTTGAEDGPTYRTQHAVEGLRRAGEGLLEVHARWSCEWAPPAAEGELPHLRSIVVREHTAVRSPQSLFQEITASVFADVAGFEEQLGPELAHWAARIDRQIGPSLIGHEGLAVGDANGDGLEDLYVLQPGGLPNRLYLRNADGTVRDGSAEAGVDFLDPSRSALFCDLDDDGDADLVVEVDPRLAILENDGTGRFVERARLDLGSTTSLAAADVDLDGDLDLYACGYIIPDAEHIAPVPYHDANNGRPNTLLRNDGTGDEWRFTDVTAEVGLDENNRRFSFAACFEDVDDDGDPDLYVSNDFGRNNLYVNEGGRFRDRAAEAGVEDLAAGMGVTFADVDRDGDFDLHVSNMFSSAGERITADERFRSDRDDRTIEAYRRHARGNSLFLGRGDGTFEEASMEAGITVGRWAWGAIFCELDNDGWPDLYVPNGFVTGTDPDDL